MDDQMRVTLVKGAPEVLLPLCRTYYEADGTVRTLVSVESVQNEVDIASRRGIRVIALATTTQHIISEHSADSPPENLTLVGIIGIKDEIRPSTKTAIREAHSAGIQTVMITGDKKETAVAVAFEIGLVDSRTADEPAVVLTSSDLKRLTDEELQVRNRVTHFGYFL
jgi:P-type E1-E2 ATPase